MTHPIPQADTGLSVSDLSPSLFGSICLFNSYRESPEPGNCLSFSDLEPARDPDAYEEVDV